MKKATLRIVIDAREVDGKEVIQGAPKIVFECDDFAFCPVTVKADKEFVEKECRIPIDYLINLGEQLAAFERSRDI